ncbi:endonuclease III domain-containing protein [Aureimonas leprariae]|uniref:Endonuclease III n=1 Tax=Plantimonas leprariae TaxID=2615207 RepID=A0A7V7TUR3_9HYPH|nr:endonuclease III [Aureimonas leprariae]KAB0676809.1 endonuclease III [Aureimonas leprariae]
MAKHQRGQRLLPESEVEEAFRRLKSHMPGRTATAKGPKDQPDPFRSVVSCILSAQSLDRNTAAATNALFALVKTPDELLALPDEAVAQAIRPCGLYNMKTRNLKALCRTLIDEHERVVPQTREELMRLPGVGRKCADIVMSFTFDADVIAVDTHVNRVANRIGITDEATADRTAQALETRAPAWAQRDGHFWLIQFGKAVCKSQRPRCETCFLNDLCLFFSASKVVVTEAVS